jgi:hypothetical protein
LRHHFFHLSCVLHQFPHLIKAPQQIIYLRDGGTAPARDALTPPGI